MPASSLRLHMLGGFRLWVDSVAVDARPWRLRKSRTLIKLLGLAPGHQLHREQVLAHLWPDLEPTAAANNLHQALHVARCQLAVAGTPHRFLTIQDEHVHLCPEATLWVDVDAFETAAAQARTTQDPAAYRNALALYAGELLPDDRYDEWTLTRREWLAGLNTKLKLELAGLLGERAAVAEALDVLDSILFQDPAHEQTCLLYIRLCASHGLRQRAIRCYSDLRAALARDLDIAHSEECAQAYRELLAAPPRSAGPEPADDGPDAPTRQGHSLPVPATAFIGRDVDLEKLRQWLTQHPGTSASGNHLKRLVTLTGVGGVGRLAWRSRRWPAWRPPMAPSIVFVVFSHQRGQGGGTVPGAVDNLSASALTVAMCRFLVAHPSLIPPDTEIRFVSFGAEEAGLRGSRRYVARHRDELKRLDARLRNIEMTAYPEITILTSEVNGTVKISPAMIDDVVAAAQRAGVPYKVKAATFGTSTDAGPFSRAGLQAATVLPFRVPQQLIAFYHQRKDGPQALTIEPMRNVLKLALEWLSRGGEEARHD